MITIDDIKSRLETFGYTFDETADAKAVAYAQGKAEAHILNVINDTVIPEETKHAATDAICAEFLSLKKGTGQLPEDMIETVVKSVKLGDTSITLDESASVEQQFDAIIHSMLNYHSDDFIRFRKLVW